jgi:hypothetical protein
MKPGPATSARDESVVSAGVGFHRRSRGRHARGLASIIATLVQDPHERDRGNLKLGDRQIIAAGRRPRLGVMQRAREQTFDCSFTDDRPLSRVRQARLGASLVPSPEGR